MEITVKIKIKDVELELTEKEAEELYSVLHKFVGEERVQIIEKYKDYWNPYWWSTHRITWEDDNFDWKAVYCGNSTTMELKAGNIS